MTWELVVAILVVGALVGVGVAQVRKRKPGGG